MLSNRKTTLAGRSTVRRGFTLMELMVAVSLLMLMILAIARIFKDASRAVSMSQASLEMFSNVRAVQEQIASDVSGMDRNTFLVIRSRSDTNDPNHIKNNNIPARRQDQIVFMANGTFTNRTGTTAGGFADSTSSHSALVWYGHGIVQADNAVTNIDQSQATNINDTATGNADTGAKDQDLVLCRHATLLMAANGATNNSVTLSDGISMIPAYPDVILGTGTQTWAGESLPAHISTSRVAAAMLTPSQLMQSLINGATGGTGTRTVARFEANNYCYRFRVLPNPYATTVQVGGVQSIVNGTLRMHPILLQGCPDFEVEWTDGTVDAAGGQLVWYGPNNPKLDDVPNGFDTALNTKTQPAKANGDDYTAVFSFDNRYRTNGVSNWPKALKITYRATDPMDKLQGGREFVQVLKLPN